MATQTKHRIECLSEQEWRHAQLISRLIQHHASAAIATLCNVARACARTPVNPDALALGNAARVMKETTEHANSRRAEYESLAIMQQLGERLVGYAQASGVLT